MPVDPSEIDGVDSARISEKYALVSRKSIGYLINHGRYYAIEAENLAQGQALAENVEKAREKALGNAEAVLADRIGDKKAEVFFWHLKNILSEAEDENKYHQPENVAGLAEKYSDNNDVSIDGLEGSTVAANLVIYAELVSFGFRYAIEGGVPDASGHEVSTEAEEKARQRARAADKKDNTFFGLIKSLFR